MAPSLTKAPGSLPVGPRDSSNGCGPTNHSGGTSFRCVKSGPEAPRKALGSGGRPLREARFPRASGFAKSASELCPAMDGGLFSGFQMGRKLYGHEDMRGAEAGVRQGFAGPGTGMGGRLSKDLEEVAPLALPRGRAQDQVVRCHLDDSPTHSRFSRTTSQPSQLPLLAGGLGFWSFMGPVEAGGCGLQEPHVSPQQMNSGPWRPRGRSANLCQVD